MGATSTDAPHGWRVWWQDFRGCVPGVGQKAPPKQSIDFPTKKEARR